MKVYMLSLRQGVTQSIHKSFAGAERACLDYLKEWDKTFRSRMRHSIAGKEWKEAGENEVIKGIDRIYFDDSRNNNLFFFSIKKMELQE